MDQQPDKLFRDKLANLQKPAPESAWNRIEAGMTGSKKAFPWWRVAAAVLLLMVVGGVWLGTQMSSTDQPPTVATNNTQQPAEQTTKADSPRANEGDNDTPRPIEPQDSDEQEKATTTETAKKLQQHIARQPAPAQIAQASKAPVVKPEQVQEHNTSESISTPIVTDEVLADNTNKASNTSTSMKLVITSVESQQYEVKNSIAEATPSEKKSSRLKKVLEKAQDIKEQDPFGDLRQMKNEILALNFQREKKDVQNNK